MLFPIGDDDRKLSGPALVTWGVIVANVVVFFILQEAGLNEAFTYGWSVVPREITEGIDLVRPELVVVEGQRVEIPQAPGPPVLYLTLFSAMFMHAGYMHLFGNLLYLWIFGDNVEHRFGHGAFLSLYLVSGLVAALAQVALDPSGVVPTLGASGAISGVLGAYLVLFPRNRVHALFFIFVVSVPAVVAIGLWIVFQFVYGLGSFAGGAVGGVAYGAHIGGFFAGVFLAIILRVFIREKQQHVFMRVPDPAARRFSRW